MDDLLSVLDDHAALGADNIRLRAENERLSKQHDQCHDTNTGLIIERAALKAEVDTWRGKTFDARTDACVKGGDLLIENKNLKAENERLQIELGTQDADLIVLKAHAEKKEPGGEGKAPTGDAGKATLASTPPPGPTMTREDEDAILTLSLMADCSRPGEQAERDEAVAHLRKRIADAGKPRFEIEMPCPNCGDGSVKVLTDRLVAVLSAPEDPAIGGRR
jgi:hypothetical protein